MKAVLGFTSLYMVLLLGYGVVIESPLAYLYTGITVLLFVVFGLIHRWARFPLEMLWALSLVGLGNMIGGVLLVDGQPLYAAGAWGPLPFDKAYHAAAAAVFLPVAWAAMKRFAGHEGHRPGLLMLTFLVVMGGGAVVEIAELIGASISDVSVGDYGNNALDLVANAVGALAGLVYVVWRESATSSAD
jgi:hypothetical protein